MGGLEILDLILGLIFIYFLVSIICSSIVEMVLTGLKVRAQFLEKWVLEIFNEKLGKDILNHAAVRALSQNDKSTDYIHASNFTSALLDRISFDSSNLESISSSIDDYVKNIQDNNYALNDDIKRLLLTYANEVKNSKGVKNEIADFKKKIEIWYDSSMERVSGAIKQNYIRPLTATIAIIVVCALNIDSIAISKYLYSNPEARAKIALEATKIVNDSNWQKSIAVMESKNDSIAIQKDSIKNNDIKNIKDNLEKIKKTEELMEATIPLGWNSGEQLSFQKIIGFLMTACAVMMGAPFWFDLINKIVNIRGTGKRPEEVKNKK